MGLAPTLEALSIEYGDTLKVVKVNVEEHTELSSSYNVRAIPNLSLFVSGAQVSELIGAHPKERIKEFLSKHLE